MKAFILLVVASSVACQELPVSYNAKSVAAGVAECAPTREIRERIKQDLRYQQ